MVAITPERDNIATLARALGWTVDQLPRGTVLSRNDILIIATYIGTDALDDCERFERATRCDDCNTDQTFDVSTMLAWLA